MAVEGIAITSITTHTTCEGAAELINAAFAYADNCKLGCVLIAAGRTWEGIVGPGEPSGTPGVLRHRGGFGTFDGIEPDQRVDFVYFTEVPRPRGCSAQAVQALADDVLIPYAKRHYPRYYRGTGEGEIEWQARVPICRDLDSDGDRELIVRLICCTGGSLSPWAIFTHDASGQWRLAYAQIRDTVFRLSVRRRVVRTRLPAPYEGGCTRYVRYREVRWTGFRYRSRLTPRSRVQRARGC